MWYGENRSGRETPWKVGDLLRYADGPTALMRITAVNDTGDRGKGISTGIRYSGRAFHSFGPCTGRYHGQCFEPPLEDFAKWNHTHDSDDRWIRGAWL
jgi:hypothetical protein